MTDPTPTNPRGLSFDELIAGQRAGQMVPPTGGPDHMVRVAAAGDRQIAAAALVPGAVLGPDEPDLTDGEEVDGLDPEDALEPGAVTDVEHDPPTVTEDHPDYVEPADVPEPDDAGGRHLA